MLKIQKGQLLKVLFIMLLLFLTNIKGKQTKNPRKVYEIKIVQIPESSQIDSQITTKEGLVRLINDDFNEFLKKQSIFIEGAPISSLNPSNSKQPTSEQQQQIYNQNNRNQNLPPNIKVQKSIQVRNLNVITETPKEVVNREFQGIGLYHQTPIVFTVGEIFKFSGIIEKDLSTQAFPLVHVSFQEIGKTDSTFSCTELLERGQTQFKFGCKMKMTGRFFFSVFAGRSGLFSRTLRLIENSVDPFFVVEEPPTPSNLKLQIRDNDLYAKWDSEAALTTLKISQQDKERQFMLANYHEEFKIPFYQFEDFEEITTKVEITHASSRRQGYNDRDSNFSKPLSLTFEAFHHKFSRVGPEASNFGPIPWKIDLNQPLELKGNFSVDVQNKLFIVYPNLTIQRKPIIPQVFKEVRAGKNIVINVNFREKGVHLIEINYLSGAAIINKPIYVGNGYPLLPDFQDLRRMPKDEQTLSQSPTSSSSESTSPNIARQIQTLLNEGEQVLEQPLPTASLAEKRQYLLYLLNQLRQKHGLGPVNFNDRLNKMAQEHTQDMIRSDFVGHVNKNGEDAFERAQRSGFIGSIGQNIAVSDSLTNAHLSLQRSPAHLQNSVNKDWTRVGFGIALDRTRVYVTILFSSRDLSENPISENDLLAYQKQITKIVVKNNPTIRSENIALSRDMRQWQKSQSNRKTRLLNFLQSNKNHYIAMSMTGRTLGYSPDFIEQFEGDDFFIQRNPRWTRVSVTVGIVEQLLQILIVYS